jgi:hypothetical protein
MSKNPAIGKDTRAARRGSWRMRAMILASGPAVTQKTAFAMGGRGIDEVLQ